MRIGTKGDYEVLEPGVYPAELIDISDTDGTGQPLMSRGFNGEAPKPQWRFKFELEVEGEEDRYLSAWVNKPADANNIAPNANVVKIAQALLGDIPEDEDWELEDLLHKRCRLQVETYQRADGTEANKIGKFYPIKQRKEREPVAAGRKRERDEDAPF